MLEYAGYVALGIAVTAVVLLLWILVALGGGKAHDEEC